MAAWVVRGGRHGESEEWNRRNSYASIAWSPIPDLSRCFTLQDVAELVKDAYPDTGARSQAQVTGQLWSFSHNIRPGDVVVMPLKKKRGKFAIGRCTGSYRFDASVSPHHYHLLPVEWNAELFVYSNLRDDLARSVKTRRTVASPRCENAAQRLEHLLLHRAEPAG